MTESVLNSKTKAKIIEITLDLADKLKALSGEPLTSSQVKSMMLNLKKQATTVKLNSQLSAQEHKEKLAQLENEHDKAITKLQLEFDDQKDSELIDITNLYKELEEKVTKAKGDLTFGLEQDEIKTKEKVDAYLAKAEQQIEEAKLEVEKYEKILQETKDNYHTELRSLASSHKRELEQNAYDNKIAVRDANYEVLKGVAKDSGFTLLETSDFDEIKLLADTKVKDTEDAIAKAVDKAKKGVYASEGGKYKALENSTGNTISLLENDKKHLEAQVKAYEARIEDLDSRLKSVPAQIKEAVAAAKADVVTNVDTGKK